MRLFHTQIKLCCKETLGNACVNWLLMLYYKCRSRNGLGSPFGIETTNLQLRTRIPFSESEWPGKPVRD